MESNNTTLRRKFLVFLLVFLEMLSAFGPFVTDRYLSILPQMEELFHCSTSTVQFGLTMSLTGLAVGQLVFGPISDKYGRKPVLTASLLVFLISGLSVEIKNAAKLSFIGSILLVGTGIVQLAIYNILDTFLSYESLTLLMLTGVGIVFTSSTTLAMTEGRAYIGAASALFGAFGFLLGGIVSPLVGMGDILQSSMIVMLVCAVMILVLSLLAIRRKNKE